MDTIPVSGIPPQAQILPPVILTKRTICPQCHQPVMPEYYFCPNCGKKLDDAPLSTSIGAQIWLYTYSLIIMPVTCYLVYTHWKGWKYFKSDDPKARNMGIVAIVLLAISFILIIWSTYAGIGWFQQYVQTQQTQLNNISGI